MFQEAEKRGKCNAIYVRETSYIDYNKFTAINNGDSVYVRGNPGGYLWQNMPIKKIQPYEPHITCLQTIPSSSSTYQDYIEEMDTSDICSMKLECNAKPNVSETAMEEKFENEKEIRYNERAVNNSLDIPKIPICSTFLSSKSKTSEPLENRNIFVTMCDETYDNSLKFKISKRCILFVFCVVLVFIALLGFRSAGDL